MFSEENFFMMNTSKIVTQRFAKCHNTLRDLNVIRSSRQFAIELEYLPQSLSEILKGRRDVTIELLRKAIEVYSINPNYIFLGQEPMFTSIDGLVAFNNEAKEIGSAVPMPINYVSKENEKSFFTDKFSTQPLKSNNQFMLPPNWLKEGEYLCFDVSDDAMEPTIFRDDKVICKVLEHNETFDNLSGGRMYAFALKDRIIIRRFHYAIIPARKLVLTTDSLAQTAVEWDFEDFTSVWRVYYLISRKNSYRKIPNLGIYEEMKGLKEEVSENSKNIKAILSELQELKIK